MRISMVAHSQQTFNENAHPFDLFLSKYQKYFKKISNILIKMKKFSTFLKYFKKVLKI